MIEACRQRLRHFLPEYLWFTEANKQFFFEEKKRGGEGKAFFVSAAPCLIVKANDKAPMVWAFSNRKCAEGAFIKFDHDGCHLHILEMKSKLTQGEWAKVLNQLEGMYLTALAACRVLNIAEFQSVTCYIAFTEDAMAPDQSADMILMKTFVGEENPVGGDDEWSKNQVPLPFDVTAGLKKGLRNAQSNVDFGAV